MLEHTGRTTGARRFAVLEVVACPRPGTFAIASGFGARAQWFRNVRANPDVRVYLGACGPVAATARLLTSEEAAAALTAYASSHPRQWATLKPVFTCYRLHDTLGGTAPTDLDDFIEEDEQPQIYGPQNMGDFTAKLYVSQNAPHHPSREGFIRSGFEAIDDMPLVTSTGAVVVLG
jgi:deazaflavin-dependent oxidoreductase (nitroreductase family)